MNPLLKKKKHKDRTWTNTTPSAARKSGVQSVGDMGTWKVIQKAWNKKEGWMKSTKAMEIPGVGCLVQVTSQNGKRVAEAVTFVPGVVYVEERLGGGRLLSKEQADRERVNVA